MKRFPDLGIRTKTVLYLGIVATEATWERLSQPGRFSASFVGEEEVKGKTRKVRVWHIHGLTEGWDKPAG